MKQWWTEWTGTVTDWVSSLPAAGYGIALWMLVAWVWAVTRHEKKRFGVTLKQPVILFFRLVFSGLLTGLIGSLLFAGLSFDIRGEDLWWIWGVSLVLSLATPRLACLGTVAGVLSLASLTLSVTGIPETGGEWIRSLAGFRAEPWLWLAGLLHLAEWILIRLDGLRGAYPVQTRERDGQSVYGWMLTGMWPVPLLLFDGVNWLAVPVLLAYGSRTLSRPVLRQNRLVSTLHFLYALLLCGFAALGEWGSAWVWTAAFFAVAGHEGLHWLLRFTERNLPRLYVSDERGLRVLAVLPGSPAARMGIKSGDVIVRFNGSNIRTVDELMHMSEHATWCKLEVLDEQGDRHIMKKTLYEDDPRNLGVIGTSGLSGQAESKEGGKEAAAHPGAEASGTAPTDGEVKTFRKGTGTEDG
ncbi:PDZ domain-containing protein [Staphylospora marina]|uniref:PDZ domain-containing protein n=1 Tax=Staphylospora marina TaxID=2490858 RepID=UPI000F5BC4A7|nr:PDZ domain-containing protein [Staphylospora marina]